MLLVSDYGPFSALMAWCGLKYGTILAHKMWKNKDLKPMRHTLPRRSVLSDSAIEKKSECFPVWVNADHVSKFQGSIWWLR